jgi:hypothetical protein
MPAPLVFLPHLTSVITYRYRVRPTFIGAILNAVAIACADPA